MATAKDFRLFPFARLRIEDCGKFLGRRSYWKLYAIENYLRVILHSVLSVQIGPLWWDSAVDPKTKQNIERMKRAYLKRPAHANPGKHDVYYLYLPDLNRILLANSHLVADVVADVDEWVAKVEGVRLPRNLIGHMNFPNDRDRASIDRLRTELAGLVYRLEQRPGFQLKIP